MSDLKPIKHLETCQRTGRGFEFIDFLDAYRMECQILQSSAIDETERGLINPGSSRLWLGRNSDKMHLSREHVSELVAVLQQWLQTGKISGAKTKTYQDGQADDNEQVTEAWLMSIGGWKHGNDIALAKDVGYDCHQVGIKTPNLVGWQAFNTWQDKAVDIGEMPTRDHVRALCKTLGIKLKQPQ